MSLKDDISDEVNAIFSGSWQVETTTKVPTPEGLRLDANHAKKLESATVLYADLDGSTNMVDNYKWWFAADVYKAYLRCASRIIRSEGGTITAYDGDRVMAVFVGEFKNTTAVRTALKINFAVEEILRSAIKDKYPDTDFILKHVIGVDTSALHAARIGVRGDNDIVWIGRAANYAAKLCTLSGAPLWITKAVHNNMNDKVKIALDGTHMWEKRFWPAMNNMEIYRSTYIWRFD
ncbi:adenylate/guanylate cyclase domain-containing protein [Thiobacillus sp.]|uniref:adenylate/guanylate cyclase domain-containing protein n=1 Tax=Thiobacillus sp. TaxID=924 RepID=UPI00286E70C0|nr:adenylate/guanylate cyclase domain-containing protein [Thiobacillus sp.]